MTELRELWPRIRLPPLAETPALARLAIAAVWLVAGLLGRPLTTTVLLAVAVAALVSASGYTTWALVRLSWRPLLAIVLVGMLVFILSIDDGRAAATQAVVTAVLRLSLLLVVALIVVLPQDAEAAMTEAMALVRLPPRLAFELLIAARVVAGVPDYLAEQRRARRALDLSPGGLRGILAEPINAVRYAARAARQRRQSLRAGAALAALDSGRQRSMYRSVSFGRNGRYVLIAGTVVAIVALLVGLF